MLLDAEHREKSIRKLGESEPLGVLLNGLEWERVREIPLSKLRGVRRATLADRETPVRTHSLGQNADRGSFQVLNTAGVRTRSQKEPRRPFPKGKLERGS